MTMQPVQLKMARAALGLTIDELAARAGVSPGEVAGFEAGGSAGGRVSESLRVVLEQAGIELDGDSGVRRKDAATDGATIPLDGLNSANDE